MSKEEFYHEILKLKRIHLDVCDDPETFRIDADNLICDLLIKLGYGDGVEIFLNAEKWYS